MTRCGHCKARIVFGGVRTQGQRFCGDSCADKVFPRPPLAYCPDCLSETNDRRPPELWTLNGWGTRLLTDRSVPTCGACGSLGGRVWVTAFFIPVIPLGQYRLLFKRGTWMSSRFLARGYDPQRAVKRRRPKPRPKASAAGDTRDSQLRPAVVAKPRGPVWAVSGIDPATGRVVSREVEADTREEAVALATLDGLDVQFAERRADPTPADPAT